MLSIEIKVNGHPIAVIEAYNDGLGGDVADYPYRALAFSMKRDEPSKTFKGTVEAHKFSDGILELSRRMLECICDEGST